MAQPAETATRSLVHGDRARVAEHGRLRAVPESFAYLPPFCAVFQVTAPFCVKGVGAAGKAGEQGCAAVALGISSGSGASR